MGILQPSISEYIESITPLIEGDVGFLQQEAYSGGFPIIQKETALFIASLTAALKPKEILEIGCCIGFSSYLMSAFMAENGHITTIDRYGIMIDEARKNFHKHGLNDKITLIEGDALEVLRTLEIRYDLIFIDAAKGQYMEFLPHCIKLLKQGGVLLADDILLNSYIAMDRYSVPRRHRTTHKRMKQFVYAMTHTEGLQTSLLTIGQGLIMCTKTKEDIVINTEGFVY